MDGTNARGEKDTVTVTKCSEEMTCGSCSDAGTCDAQTQRDHMDRRLAHSLSAIDHRIAVMSGKGGVGKSTVAVNIAVALAMDGARVGVLDADVHGPDVPKMFGLDAQRLEVRSAGLKPLIGIDKVKLMSMAFLLPNADTPIAWRGPMKHTLFQQFLADVAWGELDYLIIDLPPGTGDEPLSIAQLLGKPLGAVVVTTPQDVALLDSRKSVVFAKTLEMSVLGIIENMSAFSCPHCGERIDLFKTGGGRKAAVELGVPFLGSIPMDPMVVQGGDSGFPLVSMCPDSEASRAFRRLAGQIRDTMTALAGMPGQESVTMTS